MDFATKATLRSQGRTRDEVAAREIAWELVDEPIQLFWGEDRTRFYWLACPQILRSTWATRLNSLLTGNDTGIFGSGTTWFGNEFIPGNALRGEFVFRGQSEKGTIRE